MQTKINLKTLFSNKNTYINNTPNTQLVNSKRIGVTLAKFIQPSFRKVCSNVWSNFNTLRIHQMIETIFYFQMLLSITNIEYHIRLYKLYEYKSDTAPKHKHIFNALSIFQLNISTCLYIKCILNVYLYG